jgi:hypothetical protein
LAPAAARDALSSMAIEPNGSLCGCEWSSTHLLDGERFVQSTFYIAMMMPGETRSISLEFRV